MAKAVPVERDLGPARLPAFGNLEICWATCANPMCDKFGILFGEEDTAGDDASRYRVTGGPPPARSRLPAVRLLHDAAGTVVRGSAGAPFSGTKPALCRLFVPGVRPSRHQCLRIPVFAALEVDPNSHAAELLHGAADLRPPLLTGRVPGLHPGYWLTRLGHLGGRDW